MENKRGLSAVVATISLVLLTFIAVAVIASFVVPFVRDNLISGSGCFPYREYYTFEIESGYACYEIVDGGEKEYRISVRGNSLGGEEEALVSGLKLSFIEGGSTEVVDIASGSASSGARMLNSGIIAIPKSGEVRTYAYVSSADFESVEVFPVLTSGRTCDRSDEIEIEVCGL